MASEVRRLTKALAFAAEAHRNQRRKGAGQEPYINHLIEVLDLVISVEAGDMDVLIAALLHDVLEDTRTGYDELAAAFGESVADRPGELGRYDLPKPERRRARLAGISKKSREARLVKFADIVSNLRAIAVSPPAGWSNDRRLGYLNSAAIWWMPDAVLMPRSNASLTTLQKRWSRPSGPKSRRYRRQRFSEARVRGCHRSVGASRLRAEHAVPAAGRGRYRPTLSDDRANVPVGHGANSRRHLREPAQIDAHRQNPDGQW